jgi:hypothetical protein
MFFHRFKSQQTMAFSPVAVLALLVIGIIILIFMQQRFFPAKAFKDKKTLTSSPDDTSSSDTSDGNERDILTSITTLANQINGWNYQRA